MKKIFFLLKHIDPQSQAIHVDKNNLNQILHIQEDGANGCASGDIEQFNFKNLLQIWERLHWIDDFLQAYIWWWPQVNNEFEEYVNKNPVQNS